MQQPDYNAYYQYPHHQSPNPAPIPNPPIDHHQNSYASAPPFTTNNYATSDYPILSPTAPSYTPSPTSQPPTLNPNNLQSTFNPPYDSHGPYQPPTSQQSYYSPYDQPQTVPNYAPPPSPTSSIAPNPNPNPNPNPVFTGPLYNPAGPSSVFDSNSNNYQYENSLKFDPNGNGGYFDDKYGGGGYNRVGSDLYNRRPESRFDDGYGDGVYAYEGSKVEPYGARGTAPKSSTWAMFDDYGRAINLPSAKDSSSVGSGPGSGSGLSKIVRAVPKAETQQDVKSGVQKFRVKLLAESGGMSTMDVLCQIGLDGIRMLDPNTGRTLRIYPLENITRCDKTDSSTFAFWSKSSVDIEPRRIRLQSNSYTTNTLLDTVTAATVQFKEMGGSRIPTESSKTVELATEKKKGLVDWMNLIKPGNEEKDHWVPDEAVSKCTACGTDFGAFVRKHHCRNCGDIFCDKCTHGRIALTVDENAQPVRVCDRCMAEVTQRLSNAKEAASKPAALQSHEDLARKLQEEMEKNRKASSGSKSDGTGRRMKEVACPTCTVHLQVQVPSSGSETIECGVCQHPFLVSAH